jgi:fumarate reductase subunit C
VVAHGEVLPKILSREYMREIEEFDMEGVWWRMEKCYRKYSLRSKILVMKMCVALRRVYIHASL